MAKYVCIPVETLRQLVAYNPTDGTFTWKPRLREMFQSQRAFRISNTMCADSPAFITNLRGYAVGSIFGQRLFAHRVAWAMSTGQWPSDQIDHINGDRKDNRIINLRAVDQSSNMRNQRLRKGSVSGITGVTWDKTRNKWYCSIKDNGRTINLGRFSSLKCAISARKAAEAQFGYHPNHGRA